MTSLRFTKMHGCGNDYVHLDALRDAIPGWDELPGLARRLSDRHTGVGADGLIVLCASTNADAAMVVFNADGSRAEMCGNGLRCTAKLAWDHGHLRRKDLRIETGAGILEVKLHLERQRCTGATVVMGRPRLTAAAVPVRHGGRGPKLTLRVSVDGLAYPLVAVGMGNPHAVCFVEDADAIAVDAVGPRLEHHPRFPQRTNVEFVTRLHDEGGLPVLRQRTWERGAGETRACGTGACAAVVAAILMGRIAAREALVRLDGGDLRISWPRDDAPVVMSGPAVTVFDGTWPLGR